MVRGPVALEEDILLNLLFSFICLFLLSGDIQGEEKGPIGGSLWIIWETFMMSLYANIRIL